MIRRKAKAIASHIHRFKDGEIIELIEENDEKYLTLKVFIFQDGEGTRQDLIEGEFEWLEDEDDEY